MFDDEQAKMKMKIELKWWTNNKKCTLLSVYGTEIVSNFHWW